MPETNYIRDKMRRANFTNDMTEIMPASSGMTEINNDATNEDTAYFRNAEEIKVFIIKSQKTYATVLFFLVGFSISLAIAGIQVTYKVEGYKKRREHFLQSNFTSNSTVLILKEATSDIFLFSNIKLGLESLLSVISFATSITLYYYYRTVFLLKKVRNNYSKDTSFVQANPLFKKFLIEILVCALHIPPIVSAYVHPKFQLLVFVRIYLIGRYLQQKHSLMHSQSTRCLARLGNTELTSMFLVKASFRKFPFQMMMFGYTSFILISTYVVWLLEEQYSYFDTMWMLIVAMTTVGYGDLTPKTTLGRVAVSLASLVGILFIAIFCFLASQALILSRTEKRVLAYYECKERARQKKVAALNVIGMWYKYYAYKSKLFPTNENDMYGYEGATSVFPPRQQKLCSTEKLTFTRLKTNMCHGITFWRLMRNDPNGPTYNQDFVIEDMKIMVHNMSENVDKMFEQITGDDDMEKETEEEEITSESHETEEGRGRNTKQMANHNYVSERSQTLPPHPRHHQEVIPLVKVVPPPRVPCDIHYAPTRSDNSPMTTTSLPHYDDRSRAYQDDGLRRRNEQYHGKAFNNPHAARIIEDILADGGPHGGYESSPRDKNIMIAFNLMKIQHNILNNAIETIYHKTKHDISDIQRRVNSFVRVTRNNRYNSFNNYETGL